MRELAELTGFIAAHAIWSVSEGEDLIPIFASESELGRRSVTRIAGERLELGVKTGRGWLDSNHDSAARSVLAYDGFIALPGGRSEAIVLDARQFGPSPLQIGIAVPYRSAEDAAGFAVFRPKLVALSGIPAAEVQSFVEQFFSGVESHEKASPIWNAAIDQSR